MHRFFINPESINKTQAHIRGDVARQIYRVLRMRNDEEIILLDNSGMEYKIRIDSVSDSSIVGSIVGKQLGAAEPKVSISLFQGILKADKFTTVLQKGTELGISTFIPITSERTIPISSEEWYKSRHKRWNKIITEAAEQSGRSIIPKLEPLLHLDEAISQNQGVIILAWENMQHRGLKQTLEENKGIIEKYGISLLIGPEGGFSAEEVEKAEYAGAITVSLGQRILRSETAGMAVASAIMYEMGELGI